MDAMEEPSLLEQVYETMLVAWEAATGAPPEPGDRAFDAACWRVAQWVHDEFEAPHDVVASIAVVCHARTWLRQRGEWDPKPQLLADIRNNGKRRLFWLVDREEAERHGEHL